MLLTFPVALSRESGGWSSRGKGRLHLTLGGEKDEVARAELLVREERLPHPGAGFFFRLSTTEGAEEGLAWCQIQSLPSSTDAGSTAVGGSDVDSDSDRCSDIDEQFRNALDECDSTDPASAATAVFPDVVSRLGDLEVQLTYREERFKKGRPWTPASEARHVVKAVFRDAQGARLFYTLFKRRIRLTNQKEHKGTEEVAQTQSRPSTVPTSTPKQQVVRSASTSKDNSSPLGEREDRDAKRELCLRRLPDSDSLQWIVRQDLLSNDCDKGSALWEIRDRLDAQDSRFLQAYPAPKKLYQAISNRCLSLFRKGEAVRPAEGRYRVPGRALPQPLSVPQAKPQLKPQPKLKPQPQPQPKLKPQSKPELQPGPSQTSPSTNSNRLKRHVGPVAYAEFSSTESDSISDDEDFDDHVENWSPAEGSSFSRRQPSRNNQPRNSASARIEPALRTESAVDPSKSRTSHSPLSRRQTTSRKGKERLVESSSASDLDVTSHIDARPHKKIRVIGSFGGSDSDLENSGTSAQSTPPPEYIAKTSLATRVASAGAQRTPTKYRRGTREDKVRLADGTCVSRDLVQAFVQLAPNTTSVIEEALDELSATSSPPLGASSRTASSSDPNSSSRSTNHHPAPTGVSLDVLQPWIRAHLALQGNTSMPENATKRFKVDRMTELVVLSLVENEELVELEGGLYAKRSASSRT